MSPAKGWRQPIDKKRSKTVIVKLTAREKEELMTRAKLCGMTMSDYIRKSFEGDKK